MVQSRTKLIELFISNLANSVVHEILEKAIDREEIADKYRKEIKNSIERKKDELDKLLFEKIVIKSEIEKYQQNLSDI